MDIKEHLHIDIYARALYIIEVIKCNCQMKTRSTFFFIGIHNLLTFRIQQDKVKSCIVDVDNPENASHSLEVNEEGKIECNGHTKKERHRIQLPGSISFESHQTKDTQA